MYEGHARKLRSEDTWRAVRRAWEAGETAASLAQRYDVGLANLWKRRASEGWKRRLTADPDPEPPEGWDRYAQRKQAEFEHQLEETRLLAVKLAEAMRGGPLEQVPVWRLGFVLEWRAENLPPDQAARDRESLGWTILRFSNEEALSRPERISDAIRKHAREPASNLDPSPSGRRCPERGGCGSALSFGERTCRGRILPDGLTSAAGLGW